MIIEIEDEYQIENGKVTNHKTLRPTSFALGLLSSSKTIEHV
jgi:hypothetical protein